MSSKPKRSLQHPSHTSSIIVSPLNSNTLYTSTTPLRSSCHLPSQTLPTPHKSRSYSITIPLFTPLTHTSQSPLLHYNIILHPKHSLHNTVNYLPLPYHSSNQQTHTTPHNHISFMVTSPCTQNVHCTLHLLLFHHHISMHPKHALHLKVIPLLL